MILTSREMDSPRTEMAPGSSELAKNLPS
jgi:hypothetical protein